MTEFPPVEVRSAQIANVDYPNRIVELIAVPYDTWATVEYQGRLVEESVAPGAFGKVDRRVAQHRPTVNLEHDREQWVGRVAAVDPDDPTGLRAQLLIRRGPQFEQVLDDAADGMYAASVGMAVFPKDQTWTDNGTRRRIVKAFLDHIALTVTPAYAGTDVLAVRTAPPAVNRSSTPNLDRILAERDAAAYGGRVDRDAAT